MTNWITLTEPANRTITTIENGEQVTRAIPGEPFHLRADIITEIVPSAGETVIRTSTGGQYVCAETAAQVLEMVSDEAAMARSVKDLLAPLPRP